ncbi:hypothetical protein TIFTF001_024553 [Ficus carica]|uniref:SCP domain-containing protein n=1 Tax=Ficus carica TaxID=3494 RepID=A0AA88DGX7_FICCA|nr:hypothetical protein TIFTF001_024553 [Ficus carica]
MHIIDSQDFLNAHNSARAEVGVGPMTWESQIAAFSLQYLNTHISDCNMVHSVSQYGENLAWSSGKLSGSDAVRMWVDEKADYDYNSNSCAPGKVCRQYTQVVWRNLVRLGCAKVRCNSGGGTWLVATMLPGATILGRGLTKGFTSTSK